MSTALFSHPNQNRFQMRHGLILKVKYLSNSIEEIKSDEKSDWIDLRCAETIELKAGESILIPLGIAVQLPTGYEAHIVPRSSTFKNYGIIQTNGIGIIDESYCGDNDQWYMPVYATRDTTINKNDRICQFRIMAHQPSMNIEIVNKLGNEDRNGIGSTGIR